MTWSCALIVCQDFCFSGPACLGSGGITDEIVTKARQWNDPGGQRKHPSRCGNADLDGVSVITFRATEANPIQTFLTGIPTKPVLSRSVSHPEKGGNKGQRLTHHKEREGWNGLPTKVMGPAEPMWERYRPCTGMGRVLPMTMPLA